MSAEIVNRMPEHFIPYLDNLSVKAKEVEALCEQLKEKLTEMNTIFKEVVDSDIETGA